jgi:hypothetical protein
VTSRLGTGKPLSFFHSESSTHASDFSADGSWIFGLENALVLYMTLPNGSKFCMRQRPVACKATNFLQAHFKKNYLNQNEDAIKKYENLRDTLP